MFDNFKTPSLTTWDQLIKKVTTLEEENSRLSDIETAYNDLLKIADIKTVVRLEEENADLIEDRDGQKAGWDASAAVVSSL